MAYESIESETALITGGSQGIGLGIANAFLVAGDVIITGRDRDKLRSGQVLRPSYKILQVLKARPA